MAVRPCAQSVRCPGTDSPIENYSSEAPDPLRFIGIGFAPPDKHNWHDPNGFSSTGCLGVCYSEVSQEDADLCAALQAYLCDDDDCDPADPDCTYTCPGDPRCSCTSDDTDPNCTIHCPGDPRCPDDCIDPSDPSCRIYHCPGDPRCPTPVIYYSQEQICNAVCADGSSFTWVIPARQFAADSQLLADRMAASYCRKQAALHRVCLSNIPTTAIEGVAYKNPNGSTVRIIASGLTVATGHDTWILVSGLVPPGLTLHLNQEIGGSIALDGVLTTFGAYTFTVKVTTPAGDFMVKTYTITVSGLYNDMGMDQAVYHPTRGTVFGVRGGYLFEFQHDSATLLAQRSRYTVPGLGDASIAYDAGTDRLYVAYWNDPGDGIPGDPSAIKQRMYKINPATLAVESSLDFSVLDAGRDYTPAYSGPRRIISALNRIYGGATGGNGNNKGTRPFWYDPAGGTSVVTGSFGDYNVGGWHSMMLNSLDTPGRTIWIVQCDEKRVYFCDQDDFTRNTFLGLDVGFPIFDGCINPVNGQGYFTTKTGTIVRVSLAHALLAPLTIPGTNPYVLCIRYNPFNLMLYAADVQNNTVFVIDPITDTVVATKTGFDSPMDFVFTPTKVFTTQQGIVGIKEVV